MSARFPRQKIYCVSCGGGKNSPSDMCDKCWKKFDREHRVVLKGEENAQDTD